MIWLHNFWPPKNEVALTVQDHFVDFMELSIGIWAAAFTATAPPATFDQRCVMYEHSQGVE
jgi:hypothetical protein